MSPRRPKIVWPIVLSMVVVVAAQVGSGNKDGRPSPAFKSYSDVDQPELSLRPPVPSPLLTFPPQPPLQQQQQQQQQNTLTTNETAAAYSYGYSVMSGLSSVYSTRQESRRRDGGDVTGHYSYLRPDGVYMTVRYIVDDWGYKAKITESKTPPDDYLDVGSDRAIYKVQVPGAPPIEVQVTKEELQQYKENAAQQNLSPSTAPSSVSSSSISSPATSIPSQAPPLHNIIQPPISPTSSSQTTAFQGSPFPPYFYPVPQNPLTFKTQEK